jgi:hypothetical protein
MDVLQALSEFAGLVESASPGGAGRARAVCPVAGSSGGRADPRPTTSSTTQIRVGRPTVGPWRPLVGRDPTTDVRSSRRGGFTRAPGRPRRPVGHWCLRRPPGRTVRARLGMLSAAADHWRARRREIDRYPRLTRARRRGSPAGRSSTAPEPCWNEHAGLVPYRWRCRPHLRAVRNRWQHGVCPRIPGYRRPASGLCALPATRADMGLLLVSGEPGSPADRAGLLLGDVAWDSATAPCDTTRTYGLLSGTASGRPYQRACCGADRCTR